MQSNNDSQPWKKHIGCCGIGGATIAGSYVRHVDVQSISGASTDHQMERNLLSIWNIAGGKLNHEVKPADCHAIGDLTAGQFTPDGKFLIVRSRTPPPRE
jgi:hypothetical protein